MRKHPSITKGVLRKQIPLLLILICLTLISCNFPIKDLAFTTHPYSTLDPRIFESPGTTIPPFAQPTVFSPKAFQPTPSVDETLYHVYASQSGDTLRVVASHYSVSPLDITSSLPIPSTGIIPPGQYLVIPKTIANQEVREIVLPDSAVIDSPCAQDFDITSFVESAGGYLSSFSQLVAEDRISGAEVVQRVADNQSVNPRLLLAFIEYRSSLVYGRAEPADIYHPLRMDNEYFKGLYQELSLAARKINTGYYAWRNGEITEVTFTDQQSARIAPNLNAGSVGILYHFAQLYPSTEWEDRLSGADGFVSLYLSMFGDPMQCATQVEPLHWITKHG